MFAGPPISAARDVARPSPMRVLWIPGSLMKSLPTTFPMANTSPKCSTIVTMAMGTMMLIPSAENLGRVNLGIPIQAALPMAEKSTRPRTAQSR